MTRIADTADKIEGMPKGRRHEHEVAIILLRDPDGCFFLSQRRADKKVFPLKWGAGAGGKVEEGEDVHIAAARELREETGIDASPSFRFTMTYEDEHLLSLMHVHELTVDRSSVAFDESEWCDFRWVTAAELETLATQTDDLCPDTAAFVRRYLNVEVVIDHAQVEDADCIATLIAELEQYYGSVDIEQRTESVANIEHLVFGPTPSSRVLLARMGDQVVGLAAYSYLWPASGTTQSMFLKELYVRPSYRRQGVARQLMERLRSIAADSHCDRIDWTVDKSNDSAVGFYAALGLQVNDEKLFYRMTVSG